jgi:putative oxygen-independent coproporphyrinogen III oxidase
VRQTWTAANDIEVTLEANPGSVEAGRFRGYADAGVNRISMGIQALNDRDLQRLGRMHSAAEARAAFDIARGVFDRVSFDLIYARQDQTVAEWRAELQQALSMAIDHLSLYQLTIEDGTAFADRLARGGLRGLPGEDLAADMYEATQEVCDAHGMPAYEVSNHAREGAESRHNLIYWRMGDYAGIGPGAHGRLTLNGQRLATEAPKPPGAWLARVERGESGDHVSEALGKGDQATELAVMSLRLSEGMEIDRFEAFAPGTFDRARLHGLSELGLLEQGSGRLRATRAGRMVLNGVLRQLLG